MTGTRPVSKGDGEHCIESVRISMLFTRASKCDRWSVALARSI